MTSFFIRGDWNANVGNPEIRGVTGKFGPGVQNNSSVYLLRTAISFSIIFPRFIHAEARVRVSILFKYE